MPSVRQPPTSKRRRSSEKNGRRFSVKDSRKQSILPTSHPVSRKPSYSSNVVRVMAVAAMALLFFSASTMLRRVHRARQLSTTHRASQHVSRSVEEFHRQPDTKSDSDGNESVAKDAELMVQEKPAENAETDTPTEADTARVQSETERGEQTEPEHKSAEVSTETIRREQHEEPLPMDDPLESIEWYTRSDYMEGTRPMCRVSKPYLLSNGTILVPAWMSKYEKLLDRCGLGKYGFYPVTGPEGLEKVDMVDADFALTIHPERFQEPTHAPTVYLTEHILKSSYLFDVFGGYANVIDGVTEHHCYTTASESKCEEPRPVRAGMKPAIFVPKRIESAPSSSWPRKYVDMFGTAHGHGQGVLHLNASSLLNKEHEGQSENIYGTRFRTIMITPGMFRHLPDGGLKQASIFSAKNGIEKTARPKGSGMCSVTIGIAHGKDAQSHGVEGASDLKDKIEELGKYAMPEASIEVKTVEIGPEVDLDSHVKEMQTFDLYVAGSGDDMSSIGFLRQESTAVELMPFALQPVAHKNLARILGIHYESFRSKPHDDDFKRCIDGEIFSLRKRGKLDLTGKPEWFEPLMKAWDDAVRQYALSGSSDFDIITAEKTVNNYHSRACALKQRIEIAVDDIARKVINTVKESCSSPQT
ncbi:hypothetical protein FGB62_23g122 [Gracilaria domingensis]|nr:hypothetical protein FGB62_23g122 [Gracilaria domingensis]